jgi:hypothetical protein
MYCSKTTALWLERFAMNNHYNIVNYQSSIQTREERLIEKREYSKEYYKKKREANKQSISCQCGGRYSYSNKSHHEKSKKHQRWKNNE